MIPENGKFPDYQYNVRSGNCKLCLELRAIVLQECSQSLSVTRLMLITGKFGIAV